MEFKLNFVSNFLLIVVFVVMYSLQSLANFKSFSKDIYDVALKSGDTIVLFFHASWCPVCKKQEPLLTDIIDEKGYETFVALKVDYDQERDFKKSLKVSRQSTIIVFKAGKEVERRIGVTSKDELKKLIDMGL